jgi:hypothetical protein
VAAARAQTTIAAMRWLTVAAVSLLLALPASAAAADDLTADVAEWNVVPSKGLVQSGEVRVVARNRGSLPHELVIVRTPRWGQPLPVVGRRAVLTPLRAPIRVPPGASRAITVHLGPGSYLLVDNLPGHYRNGTWVAFAVR